MERMGKALYNAILKAKQATCELNGWILVTPKIAEELLKLNVNNYRVKSKDAVAKYAKDMLFGLWEANGESITFSKDGILRNGQHRLAAIIKCGKPVLMYMIFDADPSTVYDVQHKRTCVQILRAMGYSVTPVTPSIARTVMLGCVAKSNIGDGKICDYATKHIDALKKTENIITEKCNLGKVGRRASCATVVYCMLRTGEIPETELRDFFKVLNSGDKKETNKDASSVLALRKQLMSLKDNSYDTRNRMMEYTYLAIKDFHAGISVMKNFVYPCGGKNAERLIKEVQCMDHQCSFAA